MNLTESNSNDLLFEDVHGQNSSSAHSSTSSVISTTAGDSFLDLSGTDTENTVCFVEKIVDKKVENGQVRIKIK